MIKYDLNVDDKEVIRDVLNKDLLNRNKYINVILKQLNNIGDNNTIISLDGKWGSGKTVFLKSLQYIIENNDTSFDNINTELIKSVGNKYAEVYYNAWKNDNTENILKSILYTIVIEHKLKDNDRLMKIIKNVIDFGNIALKLKTNGSLDLKEELSAIIDLKKEFSNTINFLLEQENKKKLLIIIDEVDRCKPTFAVNLLEIIKHVFDDNRIIFIFGTNNKELGNTICQVYGNQYDGYGYLDKFFDYHYELFDEISKEKYIKYLIADTNTNNLNYRFLIELIKIFDLTYREINRVISMRENLSNLYCEGLNGEFNNFIKYVFLPLALVLKIKCKKDYYNFIDENGFDILEKVIDKISYNNDIIQDIFYVLNYQTENVGEIKDANKEEKLTQLKIKLKTYYNKCFNNKNEKDNINIAQLKDALSMMY